MTNLIQQIEKAFAESDAQTISNVPVLIVEARETYRKMRREYSSHRFGSYERQVALEAIKAMFSNQFISDFDWGEAEHINRHIAAVKKTQKARNARIAAKLKKLGIESIDVDDFKVIYGQNFEGIWIIDGHRVAISVIFAGGYNIQKLHQRVLVNVKPVKKAA